jgi:hypothetical protein
VFENIFWIQNQAERLGKGIMKLPKFFTIKKTDILKETLKKDVSFFFRIFSQQESCNHTIFCPGATARCLLQSLSIDCLMQASVYRCTSVKFKTLIVLTIVSASGSSVSSKSFEFQIYTNVKIWVPCNWSLETGKIFSFKAFKVSLVI